jgi:hypothetical protein
MTDNLASLQHWKDGVGAYNAGNIQKGGKFFILF